MHLNVSLFYCLWYWRWGTRISYILKKYSITELLAQEKANFEFEVGGDEQK